MLTAVISSKPDLDTVKEMLVAAKLPDSDLTTSHCEHFFYAGQAADPAGIVGIEILGNVGLLRSLVVRDAARNSGIGSALVAYTETYAQSLGIRAIYLLTTTAESFFVTRGFRKLARDQAPAAIQNTREFSGICPTSSSLMVKLL